MDELRGRGARRGLMMRMSDGNAQNPAARRWDRCGSLPLSLLALQAVHSISSLLGTRWPLLPSAPLK
ncbi:unnamed protein product [Darwinula stevensoni]|uniref:Uncharacterized protein n=1 Tax=Darwinula stevensoni TaxID=69355 RepID=A0A7R8X335_9CRUS|nr:unnamed protein product [Darwinula stevensoni]CAG0884576.1 unnamed protein product [Darwinula stevensoni]